MTELHTVFIIYRTLFYAWRPNNNNNNIPAALQQKYVDNYKNIWFIIMLYYFSSVRDIHTRHVVHWSSTDVLRDTNQTVFCFFYVRANNREHLSTSPKNFLDCRKIS